MAKAKQKTLLIRLKKSTIGCNPKQRACVKGLGLRKINHQVERLATPEVLGMINKVHFLLEVES